MLKEIIKILSIILFFLFISCDDDPISNKTENTKWLPITETVNGSLDSIENMRILKIFGSHSEIGYAHDCNRVTLNIEALTEVK